MSNDDIFGKSGQWMAVGIFVACTAMLLIIHFFVIPIRSVIPVMMMYGGGMLGWSIGAILLIDLDNDNKKKDCILF